MILRRQTVSTELISLLPLLVTVSGKRTVCPGEADSEARVKASTRFGTCLTVILRPPACAGALAVVVRAVVAVVGSVEVEVDGAGFVGAPELFTGGVVTGGLLTAT